MPTPKLHFPKKYDLVVGDRFELFYKGIFSAINPSHFEFEISFSDGNFGNAYARKYVWTPTEGDVGTHEMTVTARDDYGEVIDVATTVLNVVDKPTSPEDELTVMCVGDSLTSGGVWCAEFYRRITAAGGQPEGYGLKNIRLIGEKTRDGANYVGEGGWKFISYNTENKNGKYYLIYGSFDKTDADQHSVYADEAGNTWKLETISEKSIKIILDTGKPNSLPESGRLTHVSGGNNTGDMTYEKTELEIGNPFWNAESSRVDFAAYAKSKNADKIDVSYVLLGWNSTNSDENETKANVRTFLDNLLSAYPKCRIKLMGIQIPSRDGFGQSYGTAWKYYEKLNYVFNLNRWYSEICEEEKYAKNLEYINISGQFDTDYNSQMATVPVNNRNSTTETRGSNGVHPAASGYLQIADAAVRNFAAELYRDKGD